MTDILAHLPAIAAGLADALRAHLALALLAGAALLVVLRRRVPALVAAALAALLAAGLGPVWSPPTRPSVEAPGPSAEITLVAANLLRTNPRLGEARDALLALEPDILALFEIPRPLAPEALGDARLAHFVPSERGRVDFAVLSARPLRRAPPIIIDAAIPFHQAVDIAFGEGRSLRLLVLHNPAPFERAHAQRRAGARQFARIATDPMVVAGDFNATPWNRTVSAVEQATGTRVAGGWRPTWLPRLAGLGDLVRPWLGLPIDQILTSPSVQVLSIRTVAIPGSDHRAQVARLRITWPSSPRPPSAQTR